MEEIKAQYEHSKFGTCMFNLCAKWTKFLVKHKALYFILNCTWGLLLTVLGGLVTSIFLIIGERPYIFDWMVCLKVGPVYWGGLSLGLSIFRDIKSDELHINTHELGHSSQNALFGIFMPFLVTIPSACRYWYQMIRAKKGLQNKPYDQFWAEDSATQCGKYMHNYLLERRVDE